MKAIQSLILRKFKLLSTFQIVNELSQMLLLSHSTKDSCPDTGSREEASLVTARQEGLLRADLRPIRDQRDVLRPIRDQRGVLRPIRDQRDVLRLIRDQRDVGTEKVFMWRSRLIYALQRPEHYIAE